MEDSTDITWQITFGKCFQKLKKKVLKNLSFKYCNTSFSSWSSIVLICLLMVEKGCRGRICHAIHRYGKAYNKYMKDYDKNKELSYLKYCDVNILYGWAILQKLPVNKFEWIEDTS